MESSPLDFKRGSGGKTPPPAYTPSIAGSSSFPQAQSGDLYNSVNYNPWAAVPTAAHPNPLSSGPTPASALQIPYAYYDPRSAHSIAAADARAKWRFWLTLLWVLGAWILCGLLDGIDGVAVEMTGSNDFDNSVFLLLLWLMTPK
ncbi:hypothetical protein GGU11DRAFT_411742 [Lentinula aff. detonsa]|nr:hypothetical protein GGU11DRAFT_411742 [Lentinula aff. detonsa]